MPLKRWFPYAFSSFTSRVFVKCISCIKKPLSLWTALSHFDGKFHWTISQVEDHLNHNKRHDFHIWTKLNFESRIVTCFVSRTGNTILRHQSAGRRWRYLALNVCLNVDNTTDNTPLVNHAGSQLYRANVSTSPEHIVALLVTFVIFGQ